MIRSRPSAETSTTAYPSSSARVISCPAWGESASTNAACSGRASRPRSPGRSRDPWPSPSANPSGSRCSPSVDHLLVANTDRDDRGSHPFPKSTGIGSRVAGADRHMSSGDLYHFLPIPPLQVAHNAGLSGGPADRSHARQSGLVVRWMMLVVGPRLLRRWFDRECSADPFDQKPSPFESWLGHPVDRQAHAAATFGGDVRDRQRRGAWAGVEAELNTPAEPPRTVPHARLLHPEFVQ
jgi:hypothetical protein